MTATACRLAVGVLAGMPALLLLVPTFTTDVASASALRIDAGALATFTLPGPLDIPGTSPGSLAVAPPAVPSDDAAPAPAVEPEPAPEKSPPPAEELAQDDAPPVEPGDDATDQAAPEAAPEAGPEPESRRQGRG